MAFTTVASTTDMKPEVAPVITLSMLPNDLILSCLARVSKLYYPTLALVSKSFRSLINSPELHETRLLLGRTKSCLYVCLEPDRKLHWFTLCRKPYQTIADSSQTNKLTETILVPIPSLDSLPSVQSGFVAVGSSIYAFGGMIEDVPSCSVFVKESNSQTWCKASSMHVARVSPTASVLDGKIYVIGGCKNIDYVNCMEIFDTKTRTWEFVTGPGGRFEYESIAVEGSVYVKSREKDEIFMLHKGRWRVADIAFNRGWKGSSCCVIENVLYRSVCGDVISWYDFNDRIWRKLEGLKGLEGRLPSFPVRLADYGGKLACLWKEYVSSKNGGNTTSIWCAEISLERRQRWQICGTVEWFGVVFKSAKQYELMHVLAPTA